MATNVVSVASAAHLPPQPSPLAHSPSIARRSLSIFSRKGSDTPAPTIQPLVAATMAFTPISLPAGPASGGTAHRSKRWKVKKTAEPTVSEGTILRAVPKESPAPMAHSALEHEMAVSPNEEILRNIGAASLPAQTIEPAENARSDPVPTSPLTSSRATRSSHSLLTEPTNVISSRRPTIKARKDGSPGEIIGVWKNGRARWGTQRLQEQSPTTKEQAEELSRPRSAGARPTAPPSTQKDRPSRPNIRLVIPNNHSARRPLTYVPSFSNANSAIEPAEMNRRSITIFDTAPPYLHDFDGLRSEVASGASRDSFRISTLSSLTLTHAPKPRRTPCIPIQATLPDEQFLRGGSLGQPLTPKGTLGPPSGSSGSSTGSASDDDDDASHNSRRTSMTSVSSKGEERRSPPIPLKDETAGGTRSHANNCSENQPAELEGSPVSAGAPRMASLVAMLRTPSVERPKKRLSSRRGHILLARIKSREEMLAQTEEQKTSKSPSPTLSEAEHDLESHLSQISNPGSPGEKAFNFHIPNATFPVRDVNFPPPPPKSAKRYMHSPVGQPRLRSRQFRVDKVAFPGRRTSLRQSVRPMSGIPENEACRKITPNAAEAVLFNILGRLDSLNDLFNSALINRGFHSVFKRHELQLVRNVLRNMCAPAWEYRETCRPNDEQIGPDSARPVLEYTPTAYYEQYLCDAYVIGALKVLILQQCRSFLREETVANLASHGPFQVSPVDNALWRIWTFCKIFGSNKGREDDVTAQIDWLRGGLLAHQETCTGTISSHDSFCLSSVLLSAPDHFGQGNKGGLSAEQLYDMTEMWNCLSHITQRVIGRTEQARRHGVFDQTEVRGGDIDGEEAMLEEWHSYVLTLGLSSILDLANNCAEDETLAFALCQERGWMNWNPPIFGGSRSTFLKEAVTRLYEERVCETFSPAETQTPEMRQLRRRRGASFATEIKQRRLRGGSVHSERPISDWGANTHKLVSPATPQGPEQSPQAMQQTYRRSSGCPIRKPPPVPPPHTPPSPPSSDLRSGSGSVRSHYSLVFPSPPPPPSPPRPSVAPFQAPALTKHSAFRQASINPALRNVPASTPTSTQSLTYPSDPSLPPPYDHGRPAANQHPLQLQMVGDLGGTINSVDKAIFRIVEMGFSPEQAKGALKITDMGDGLRVDRAVEYLLRQDEGSY